MAPHSGPSPFQALQSRGSGSLGARPVLRKGRLGRGLHSRLPVAFLRRAQTGPHPRGAVLGARGWERPAAGAAVALGGWRGELWMRPPPRRCSSSAPVLADSIISRPFGSKEGHKSR